MAKYLESETFQIENSNYYNFYIKKHARFNLFYGVTTIIGLAYLSSKFNFGNFFEFLPHKVKNV